MIEIELPVAPLSVNHAWQGRRFKTPAYRIYERDICRVLPPAKETMQGWVFVHYQYFLTSKVFAITDTGNLEKCLTDIIVSRGYITDDRKIKHLMQSKFLSDKFCIKARIYPITDDLQSINIML